MTSHLGVEADKVKKKKNKKPNHQINNNMC